MANHLAERIEFIKLIQALKHGEENPGPIILRALRSALKAQQDRANQQLKTE